MIRSTLLRPKFALRLSLACLGVLSLGTHQLAAQSFTPVEDTRTYARNRTFNYSNDDLGVDRGETSASFGFERSYLRFQVTGIDPALIDCVSLELTESTRAGDVHFEVRMPASSWSETKLTWINQPSSSGLRIGAWGGASVGNGETLQIPLNPNAFAAGDGTYDLMLVEVGSGGFRGSRFYSREGASPPRLVFGCAGMGPRTGFAVAKTDGAVPYSPNFLPFYPADTTSISWDFGDGSSSTAFDPVHTYTTPGRYTVSMTANGPAGSATAIRKELVMAYPAEHAAGSVLSNRNINKLLGGGAMLPLADGDMFGRSVGSIGDLDSDGIDDVIVGAIGDDDAGNDAGAVYILMLKSGANLRRFTKITEGLNGFTGNLNPNDGFGREVAPIGDWDGDGVLDVAVGANRDDEDGRDAGAVWLLFLNPNGTVKSHAKINATHGAPIGFNVDDEFGRGIARLEDMDGDGVPELAVGAINNSDGGKRYGCVWILFMRQDGSVKSAQKISPFSGGMNVTVNPSYSGRWWFGMSVSALGDVDGNGVTDIVVGALLDRARRSATGAAVVLLLNADGTVKSNTLINADVGGLTPGELTSNDEFGGSCAGLGDLDGDGIPDMAVGAIRDDDNIPNDTDSFGEFGAIYVFFLRADGSVRDYQKISDTRGALTEPISNADRMGEGLAGIGDFDGDGIVDLLAGSRFDDTVGLNRGSIFFLSLDNGLGGVAPMANFQATPRSGFAPLSVAFSDQSTGQASTWLWDFGDGSSSNLAAPSHTYAAAGSYDVSLTVGGPLGGDTLVHSGFVSVAPGGSNLSAYGSGVNPAGSLMLLSGDGSLGSSLSFGIDNPLDSQAAGSVAFLSISRFPDPNYPAGNLRPGFGMDGGPGELLISLNPPPILTLMASPWLGAGNPLPVTINIPSNPNLAGLTVYAQGRIVDSTPGAAIRLGLTGAYSITLIP